MLLTAQAMKLKVGNPTRKLVLLKLADNANDKGECFPSYQHIADHCEVSRRSVISHIDALIKMGLVEKKSRKNQDGSSSNLYILHLEKGSENISPPSERISPPSENGSLPPSENISPITNQLTILIYRCRRKRLQLRLPKNSVFLTWIWRWRKRCLLAFKNSTRITSNRILKRGRMISDC